MMTYPQTMNGRHDAGPPPPENDDSSLPPLHRVSCFNTGSINPANTERSDNLSRKVRYMGLLTGNLM